jgi:microsomal dipeptidase-like Zn-dependent dipeptidase
MSRRTSSRSGQRGHRRPRRRRRRIAAQLGTQLELESLNGKDAVTLDAVVEAIDAVCQIAGDAAHVGLGTDFDGGQGAEAAPAELDTIADLPKLASALAARGFADADIAAVMGGNWLKFLRRRLS